jgi:hypothetical protein
MKNIFGSIGYTYLKNDNNKILLFADKHDELPSCENKINMAEWLKSKFKSSIVLLEEVPRIDNKLLGLWETSIHTKELKDMYLENPNIVKPVDIRHFLLPFSWEVMEDDDTDDITLREYIKDINDFFCLKTKYLIENMPLYNVKILKSIELGQHFLQLKDEYYLFLQDLKKLNILNKKLKYIYNKYYKYLEDINDLLSKMMEWYVCACIYQHKNKSLLIHVGLAHSEQILKLLQTKYMYKIEDQQGINELKELRSENVKGCVQISEALNQQFGGYF